LVHKKAPPLPPNKPTKLDVQPSLPSPYLPVYGETHGRAVARDFSVSLVSVQRQLERFERSGALVCKRQGRTLVYSWNPKSRLAARLRDLVAVVHEGMSLQAKAALYPERQ